MHRPVAFITLEKQPDFPDRDLTDANADIIGDYYLPETQAVALEAKRLAEYQRPFFEAIIGVLAMRQASIQIPNEPDSYRGFTLGFASYEFMQLLVTESPYDVAKAATRLQSLYTGSETISLTERVEIWPDKRPNIYRTIVKQGLDSDEPNELLQARALGAQVAFELQQPILDAA